MAKRERRTPLLRETERLLRTHSDSKGHPDPQAVQRDLLTWLQADAARVDLERVANKAIAQVMEDLRPEPPNPQMAFDGFEPDALIPTGDGGYIWMGKAGVLDLDAWLQILTDENLDSNAAFYARRGYIRERRRAFTPADSDLTAVERRAFGWRPKP